MNSPPLPTPISTPTYPKEFQQLLQEKTLNFIDRNFVFSAISHFFHRQTRGYFTIVGSPGSGKSAILAQYATAHPHSIYYNAEIPGKNRPEDFLVSVCTQLIDKYLLNNEKTSEIINLKSQLPTLAAHDGNWFLSLLLQKVSDKLDQHQSLVIIIDSLDAIDLTSQPPSTNLFYLPRYLSDRTYFILARRPFIKEKSGLLIEAPSQLLDLRDYPTQNREDIQNYIQQYRLTAPDSTPPELWQELTTYLATHSQDNFMYVSQMLTAILDKLHSDTNLGEISSFFSAIPSDLATYYQNHFQRMGWDNLSEVELAVLGVLVAVRLGVSVREISARIDEDEYDVEKVLESWYEFLNIRQVDGEICYGLYHESFCDWLGKQ